MDESKMGIPINVPLNRFKEEFDKECRKLDESEPKDKQFTLEMAEHVWRKVKGYPIPHCYSEEDRLSIFERYYHRAVSQSQGE
jgi:glucose-6-phosphate isomerase